jgi:hypothetical protein
MSTPMSVAELEPMSDEDHDRIEKRVIALEGELKAEIRAIQAGLNEQRLWSAEHDGEIKEKWRNQDRLNADNADEMKALKIFVIKEGKTRDDRITAIEKKQMYWAGAGAVVGTIVIWSVKFLVEASAAG